MRGNRIFDAYLDSSIPFNPPAIQYIPQSMVIIIAAKTRFKTPFVFWHQWILRLSFMALLQNNYFRWLRVDSAQHIQSLYDAGWLARWTNGFYGTTSILLLCRIAGRGHAFSLRSGVSVSLLHTTWNRLVVRIASHSPQLHCEMHSVCHKIMKMISSSFMCPTNDDATRLFSTLPGHGTLDGWR